MGKVLVAYYSTSEKNKTTNEDRIVSELSKLFHSKGFAVKKLLLAPKKNINLNKQFKQEKTIELKEKLPPMKGLDFLVVGTPIVGSLSSAPLVNAFIRLISKDKKSLGKFPKVVLFSSGIIHGFELKKMASLFSMFGIKPVDSQAFTSIFDFDEKKLVEIRNFFERFIQKSLEA